MTCSCQEHRRSPVIFNPTPLQWTLLAVGGTAALILGISAVASAAGPKPGPGPGPGPGPDGGCDPSPYNFAEQTVRNAINDEIDAGQIDAELVAQSVATLLFGAHPSGEMVMFPPQTPQGLQEENLPGVLCVWERTRALVFIVFDERGIDDVVPPSSLDWVLHATNDPGYPWEEPTLHVANYPSPAMFVDIGGEGSGNWDPSMGFDRMIRAYLGSALAMAGADVGLATSPAGQELRKQARAAVVAPGGFNDLVYGQTNLNYAGGNDPAKPGGDLNKGVMGSYVLNEFGRSLNWLPRHKDNLQRIPQSLPPKRATRADGSQLIGANKGNRQMLVWLPGLNLDALAQPVPTVQFDQWSDGSSTIDPPPAIRNLGIDMSGIDLPGVEEPGIGQGGPGPGLPPPPPPIPPLGFSPA